MKRKLVIASLCVVAALVLMWSFPLMVKAGKYLLNDDPDGIPAVKSRYNKEDFMTRRAEYVGLLRGLDKEKEMPDPKLRMDAVRQLARQEERVSEQLQNTGKNRTQDAALAAAVPVNGPWTPLGPAPIPNGQTNGTTTAVSGRVSAIAVHPTNPDIAYVGTAQGGLYRTTNGGTSWTPLMDNALSLAIGAVAIAPSNPETIFVGTGEASFSADGFFGVGVYRIENASSATPNLVGPLNDDAGGADVFSGRSIGEILVHPNDPNTIFVGTVSGVGGIGPARPGVLPNAGLFRSSNALSAAPVFNKLGVTAAAATENRNVIDLVMEPGNPNRVIASVVGTATPANDNGGLFLTTNALDPTPTFTKTLDLAGTTSTATRTELAINKVGTTVTVYAASAIGTGTVYRSGDGGSTWVAAVDNNFCNPQCFYDIAIDVDPANAARVYLAGSPTLAFGISTNSGGAFTTSDNGLHVDSHAIAVAPSNPQVIYFGSDGGIYRSNNAGASWNVLNNTTFSATQFMGIGIHPTNPNFTIGGTQDNGTEMLQFNNTWRRTDFGDGGYTAIDQTSPANGAIMYHTYFNSNAAGGAVMGYAYSEDVNAFEDWEFRGCQIAGTGGGITCNDSVLFYAPLELGPGTPNTVYYGSDRLYRSDNKGLLHTLASQAPIELNTAVTPPVGIPISAIGIAPQNDNVRLVGLRTGGLWGTSGGSLSLTNLDPANTVPNVFIARAVVDHNNVNTAYVTLSAFGVTNVWKTTSLATPNWTAAAGSGANVLPQVPVSAFVIDPMDSNRLFAGTDIGVYTSGDGGANWFPLGTGLPRVATFDMGITSARKLRIATHGRGIWDYSLVNNPPVAALTANPLGGNAPVLVNFDGSGSTDPDAGDSVASYTFNFGDGSPAVTQAGATVSHTYTNAGTYTATLTVTDTRGAVSVNTATVTINVVAGVNLTLLDLGTQNSATTQTIVGSRPDAGEVRLSGPAGVGGVTITLADTLNATTMPASVTVPEGKDSARFVYQTSQVSTAETGTVTATLNSTNLSRTLTVRPIYVRSVNLSPASVQGGQNSAATVTLEFAPTTSDIVVNLTSSNSNAAVGQSTITIPVGQITSGSFTVTTRPVTVQRGATIRGTTGGKTIGSYLTITP